MGKVLKAVAVVAVIVAAAVIAPQLAGVLMGLGLSTMVATALATAVVAFGMSAIGRLLASNPSTKPTPFNFRQAVGNSFILIGKRRQGGQLIFFHPAKVGDNYYRYFVFAVAGHQCKGVVRWWLNDKEVTVDGSGKVTSGDYANAAWLWFARGTPDQAAHSTFVAECGGKWTSDHRGRGIALIYAKFHLTKDVVGLGMPVVTAEIEGSDLIHDPRTDTTGYSRNAILAAYWWMQLPREEGGFGTEADEIPPAELLSAWASICDESVATETATTEPRYSVDALIETGGEPSKVRDTFVLCMAGSHCVIDGVEMIRPGYWVPASAELDERDLDGAIRLPLLGDPQATATEVAGTYFDPATLYQPQPVPVRSVASDEVQQLSYELPFCTSHTQGQRVLEIMLRRAQCEKRLTWPMNIAGLAMQPMQTVTVGTARHGLSNYAWVIDSWSLSYSATGPQVVLGLREENPEIYDHPTLKAKAGAPALADVEAIPEEVASAVVAQSVGGTWSASVLAALEARVTVLETP